jgi:hypothetical protein
MKEPNRRLVQDAYMFMGQADRQAEQANASLKKGPEMTTRRLIERVSSLSGETNEMCLQLTDAEFAAVLAFIKDRSKSPLIQDILPNHSAEEREFILSGITPDEWGRSVRR